MARIDRLYILTTTLLLAHQVDAAYWREWKLFGIPGGIQVFVLLNVLITFPFLVGLGRVATGARGLRFALALALVGLATFAVHAWFALRGRREFGLPVSWAILGGTLLSSAALGRKALLERRAGRW